MAKDVLVVSLGRIVADQVRVEATEAYAVLQHAWQRIRASRDDDGAVFGLPPLDAMGITAFGDFEVRRTRADAARSVRPPHVLTHELAALLLRLLASGRSDLALVPRVCIDVVHRASRGANPTARPIVTPDALFRALEAFRPRDGSAVLADLFARWSRTTDRDHGGTWEAVVAANPALAAATGGVPGAHVPARTRAAESAPILATIRPRRVSDAGAVVRASGIESARASAPTFAATRGAGVLFSSAPPDAAPAPGARRARAAAAALVCLTLLGGVAAWRWAMHGDTGVVVDAQAQPSSPAADARIIDDAVVGASRAAAHTEVEVATRTPGDAVPAGRPRVRRLLHAGATGRVPYSPSFDPHRNALVFHAGLDDTALLEASLRSDGTVDEVSTVREDGSSSYHAQVSPDGQWLAYDSDAEGQRAVFVARRDGSSPRRVSGAGYASVPSWSPDGAYVAFARAEPTRPRVWNVWTVHVASGRLERQTNHAVGQPWGASWFPDGRRIAYSHEDRLIVRDIDTGASRTYPTPIRGRLVRTPAVSPDGERIVFQVRRDGAWVLDLRTGETQRILADASAQEFAWSPDGQRVAYHSVRGGQWGIWMLDLAVDAGP